MRDYVKLNGVGVETFGGACIKLGYRPAPVEELEVFNIPYRSRPAVVRSGVYKSYERTVVIYVPERYLSLAYNWASGEGLLELSSEPGLGFYVEHLRTEKEREENGHVWLAVTFLCAPFAYLLEGLEALPIPRDGLRLLNPTGHNAKPRIYLYGTGRGGVRIEWQEEGETLQQDFNLEELSPGVVLDSEQWTIETTGAENIGEHYTGGSRGDAFPVLPVGDIVVRLIGGATAGEIVPRWVKL